MKQISEYTATESKLAELREKYTGVIFPVETSKGMKEAKSTRMMFVKARTGLESVRKEIKGPALEHCQAIDSEARRITSEITALEEPITAQIKKEENRVAAEKEAAERKAREEAELWVRRIEAIKRRPLDFITAPAEDISVAIAKAETVSVDHWPEDIRDEAETALTDAILQMKGMHSKAVEDAKRIAEVEALRAAIPAEVTNEGMTKPDLDKIIPAPVEEVVGEEFKPVNIHAVKAEIEQVTQITETVIPGMVDDDPDVWDKFGRLAEASKAVLAHYGQFKNVHPTIVALDNALKNLESV